MKISHAVAAISCAVMLAGCTAGDRPAQYAEAPLEPAAGYRVDTLRYAEFQRLFADRLRYEQILSDPNSPIDKAALYADTWQEMYNQAMLAPALDYLGLNVSDDELGELIYGDNVLPVMRELAFLQKQGRYDRGTARDFTRRIAHDTVSDLSLTWKVFLRDVAKKHRTDKLNAILTAARFVTPAERRYHQWHDSREIDFDYLYRSYQAQSIGAPTDSALRAYYHKYASGNPQFETRDVRLVEAAITGDSANHPDELRQMRDLANLGSADFDAIAAKNDRIQRFDAEYRVSTSRGQLKSFFENCQPGDRLGPFYHNGTFQIIHAQERYTIPDSVRASHIVLQGDDTTRAVALLREIEQRGNFADIARRYSADDRTAEHGGDLGWFPYNKYIEPFNVACFSSPAGKHFIVDTRLGRHLVRIDEVSANAEPYVYAEGLVYRLRPNLEDIEQARREVERVTAKAANGDELEQLALEAGYKTLTTSLGNGYYGINEIEDAHDMLRWCFKNDINTVSPPFLKGENLYVACVNSVLPNGFRTYEELRDMLRDDYIAMARKDTLLERMRADFDPREGLEANAKRWGTDPTQVRGADFGTTALPSVGEDPALRGLLLGLKAGQTSEAFKGQRGVFMVRKIAERTKKGDIDVDDRLRKAHQGEIENNAHTSDLTRASQLRLHFCRDLDSHFAARAIDDDLPASGAQARAIMNAEFAFRAGEWQRALEGTGGAKGLLAFLEQTKSETKQTRLALLYAGICQMKLGRHAEALATLQGISPTRDPFVPAVANTLRGDCHTFLGDNTAAAEAYRQAAQSDAVEYLRSIALYKLATLLLETEQHAEAAEVCKTIIEMQNSLAFQKQAREIESMLQTRGQYGIDK